MTYATTRARSGFTGEVLFDDRRGTWRDAQSPATEMVLLILRTPLGKCLVRPTLGVDWSRVNKLRTDAPDTARAAVNTAIVACNAALDVFKASSSVWLSTKVKGQ